jgi:hypothetical protein
MLHSKSLLWVYNIFLFESCALDIWERPNDLSFNIYLKPNLHKICQTFKHW